MTTENRPNEKERDYILDMINSGQLQYSYVENGTESGIQFASDSEDILEFLSEANFADKVMFMLEEAFYLASLGGFEAPSEYYEAIKAYIESEGVGGLEDAGT